MANKWIKISLLLLLWSGIPLLLAPGWGTAACLAQDTKPPVAKKGFWDELKTRLNQKNNEKNPNLGVTERYSLVYDKIHQTERRFYDSLSDLGNANWERYQNIVRVQRNLADTTLKPNIKVFGWHPHWMGSAYESYRFDLLSYLAWFSYNIDSTGHYDKTDVMDALKKSPILDSIKAKEGRCQLLITITNHTPAGNEKLLNSIVLQDELIANILQLLDEVNGNGVDLNFERIPPGLKRKMTLFLERLGKELKEANPEYVLTVDIPAERAEDNFEFSRLNGVVDYYVMMGYDYYNPGSKSDGPMAPLDTTSREAFSLKHSVFRYLQYGLKREKLILALPYYSAVWSGASNQTGELQFDQYLTYRDMRVKYCMETPQYDYERWAGYYEVPIKGSDRFEKCWFDDSLTLSRKFDWILEEKLAGAGVWALGYDNGHNELWNLLEAKFATDTLTIHETPYREGKYFNISNSIMEYRALIGKAGIFLLLFMLAGLFISLFDWRVREVFFQYKTMRLLYAVGGISMVLFLYAFNLYISEKPVFESNNWLTLGIGLLLGVCLTLYVSSRFGKNRENIP
jgi:spore germination protein